MLPAGGGATEPDRLMASGISAQLFQGAAAAIHVHATCNALASELPPLGLCGPSRMSNDRKKENTM